MKTAVERRNSSWLNFWSTKRSSPQSCPKGGTLSPPACSHAQLNKLNSAFKEIGVYDDDCLSMIDGLEKLWAFRDLPVNKISSSDLAGIAQYSFDTVEELGIAVPELLKVFLSDPRIGELIGSFNRLVAFLTRDRADIPSETKHYMMQEILQHIDVLFSHASVHDLITKDDTKWVGGQEVVVKTGKQKLVQLYHIMPHSIVRILSSNPVLITKSIKTIVDVRECLYQMPDADRILFQTSVGLLKTADDLRFALAFLDKSDQAVESTDGNHHDLAEYLVFDCHKIALLKSDYQFIQVLRLHPHLISPMLEVEHPYHKTLLERIKSPKVFAEVCLLAPEKISILAKLSAVKRLINPNSQSVSHKDFLSCVMDVITGTKTELHPTKFATLAEIYQGKLCERLFDEDKANSFQQRANEYSRQCHLRAKRVRFLVNDLLERFEAVKQMGTDGKIQVLVKYMTDVERLQKAFTEQNVKPEELEQLKHSLSILYPTIMAQFWRGLNLLPEGGTPADRQNAKSAYVHSFIRDIQSLDSVDLVQIRRMLLGHPDICHVIMDHVTTKNMRHSQRLKLLLHTLYSQVVANNNLGGILSFTQLYIKGIEGIFPRDLEQAKETLFITRDMIRELQDRGVDVDPQYKNQLLINKWLTDDAYIDGFEAERPVAAPEYTMSKLLTLSKREYCRYQIYRDGIDAMKTMTRDCREEKYAEVMGMLEEESLATLFKLSHLDKDIQAICKNPKMTRYWDRWLADRLSCSDRFAQLGSSYCLVMGDFLLEKFFVCSSQGHRHHPEVIDLLDVAVMQYTSPQAAVALHAHFRGILNQTEVSEEDEERLQRFCEKLVEQYWAMGFMLAADLKLVMANKVGPRNQHYAQLVRDAYELVCCAYSFRNSIDSEVVFVSANQDIFKIAQVIFPMFERVKAKGGGTLEQMQEKAFELTRLSISQLFSNISNFPGDAERLREQNVNAALKSNLKRVRQLTQARNEALRECQKLEQMTQCLPSAESQVIKPASLPYKKIRDGLRERPLIKAKGKNILPDIGLIEEQRHGQGFSYN